jgi:DnaJ-class molecular chaperone
MCKKYKNSYVDVCRNCAGNGFISVQKPYEGRALSYRNEICNVCNGVGSVRIVKRIEVEIKPNEPYVK